MNKILLIVVFICTALIIDAQKIPDPALDFAKARISTMTLDEKIGQLFMIRAHSDKGPDHIKSVENQIKKYKVGGLCFFQGTPTKQAELTNKYQKLSDTPLMIAIDAEWGLGMRHVKSAISFPKQLTLGAISDNSAIYKMGETIARHLKRIGVHVNFAPVVDVNNNPANPVIHNRSFGEDMFNVATKSYAYAKGLQDAGVYACMKHFPGHGDTDVDSHYDLPVITHSRGRLDSLEMMPFRVLTQLGIKSLMTAHLAIPALDGTPNRPTSLSRKVVTEILQEQMYFEGLIFTDGLEMEGVAKHFKPGDMEMEAIKAGNDIMLLPIDIDKAVQQIKKAILSDRLDVEVINKKVIKILSAKYELGLSGAPVVKNTSQINRDINNSSDLAFKKKLYEKAVTLVKDEQNLVPLKGDPDEMAVLALGASKEPAILKRLTTLGIKKQIYAPKEITASKAISIKKELATYNKIVISLHDLSIYSSRDFGISKAMLDLIYELNSKHDVILVNNGSPYALKFFPKISAIIQAYEEDDLMQESAANALMGISEINGKLPVSASADFPIKTGIRRFRLNTLGYSSPLDVNISPDTLLQIDEIMQEMLSKKAAPGCQILAARHGKVFFNKTYGYHTDKKKTKVERDHLYDVASITKILATTISMMKLYEEGKIKLNHPLKTYLPQLDTTNKGPLILEDVLSHVSGLAGWIAFYEETMDKEAKKTSRLAKYYKSEATDSFNLQVTDKLYLRNDFKDTIYHYIYNNDLKSTRDYRYSDLGFYLFQQIIERISNQSLDAYVEDNFYKPMGLTRTLFNPLTKFPKEIITPSEKDDYFRLQTIQGHVHDMGAAMLGGISGHAGLFSTSEELAVLMQMLLNGGEYGGRQYLKPNTIKRFTKRHHRSTRRGLGFDMKELNDDKTLNICEEASSQAFGHLGFTGISVFADPKYDLIYIFLSNRTYPTMNNKVFSKKNYRPRVQSVFYRAMQDRLN